METLTQTDTSTNKFKDEEVSSNWGYHTIRKPRPINEQINHLKELFPGLRFSEQDFLQCGDKMASGLSRISKEDGWVWSAVPNWMKRSDLFGETYVQALQKVFDKIWKNSNGAFKNRCQYFIDLHLRQSEHTKRSWEHISETQGNPDILLVPIQLGIRHRGCSVRRARAVFLSNEFGLDAFASSIMILTRPEYFRSLEIIWIDCAGDEARKPCYRNEFDHTPFLYFHDHKVNFDVRTHSAPSERCGSASALILK